MSACVSLFSCNFEDDAAVVRIIPHYIPVTVIVKTISFNLKADPENCKLTCMVRYIVHQTELKLQPVYAILYTV